MKMPNKIKIDKNPHGRSIQNYYYTHDPFHLAINLNFPKSHSPNKRKFKERTSK
jgi:hypothetical protein